MKKKIRQILVNLLVITLFFGSMPMNTLAAEVGSDGIDTYSVSGDTVSGDDGNGGTVSGGDGNGGTVSGGTVSENETLTGNFGTNNGFTWNYDKASQTLTVTGEDSGLNQMQENLPDTVKDDMVNIVFKNGKVSGSLEGLLDGLAELRSVKFDNFDTLYVTDMSNMFNQCSKLENIDLVGFDTGNVLNMSNMFAGCSSLTSLDVSGFGTYNVSYMTGMFAGCSSLTSIGVSRFDTSGVADMSNMFAGCTSLTALDLSCFDMSSVTNASNMLDTCSGLETIHTPNAMAEGLAITLPDTFYNPQGNALTAIEPDNCNKILVKEAYTITYVVNGGLNNEGNPAAYTIVTDTIILLDPSKTGYTFGGWYTDAECTNKVTEIINGSTGDKTLYAGWIANKYTIEFAGNGATSGSMSSLTDREYGTSYKLTANKFKRAGYTFTGWNTKANGSGTAYNDKASVENLSSADGETVTLYAQWNKNEYKVTYKLNGGKNNSANPGKYYVTTSTITLKKPTRTGYTFDGWYSDASYKNKVTQIKKGSTGNKTLYAKWTANKYTIKFDGNGATSGKMSSMGGRKYNASYKLKSNTFKKKGYTFAGWNTKANGKGISYKNNASVKNLTSANGKTVTLYAQWTKTKYKITYKLNSGKNSSGNPSKYYVTTSTITLKKPTRTGYTFEGWYSDAKFKKKVTQIKKGSTGDKVLYAKWSKNVYTINYKLNGGKNNSGNPKKYNVTTTTITLKKPTKAGYTFKGWYSDAKFKKKVTQIKKGSTGNKTLYAKWVKIKK